LLAVETGTVGACEATCPQAGELMTPVKTSKPMSAASPMVMAKTVRLRREPA